jgi:C1A family cysteine protease
MGKQLGLSLVLLGLTSATLAGNISMNGTITDHVSVHQTSLYNLATAAEKTIRFERIVLSPQAKKNLAASVAQAFNTRLNLQKDGTLPSSIALDMNNVPVLDQGEHGTCVTFATTAALDATVSEMNHQTGNDYYSQLCSLELGSTLESQSPIENGEHTYPSGWDGSWGTIVLDQVKQHGLITKSYQEKNGCAGVFDYPLNVETDHGKPISTTDYDSHSEKVMPPVSYKVILNPEDAVDSKTNKDSVLRKVKKALASGHRVVFGTLLDVDRGYNGALGTYKVSHDTWVLTKDIADDAAKEIIEAGHEMIIIGYDDNAVITLAPQDQHKGVFTLRNSWSEEAGDKGNYYMTYDHFKALILEASEVIPQNKAQTHSRISLQ